jgi:ATP-GRASP peptide maturase of grasp-with-spasm system
MILILSRGQYELTTERVADWIVRLGGSVIRINAEDLWPGTDSSITIDAIGTGDRISVLNPEVDGRPIDIAAADVGAVWYRRWTFISEYMRLSDPLGGQAGSLTKQGFMARLAARNELRAAGRALMSTFADAYWLSDPETTDIDKMRALRAARGNGIEVPQTLITTSREKAAAFVDDHPHGVITKTLAGSPLSIDLPDRSAISTYTAAVDADMVAGWPATFTPSLFQEQVDKAYELRVFALGDRLWPAAIFSQDHEATTLDFRRYQTERPNRYVPYRLDDELSAKLLATMADLGLETGSIDLIRTPGGRTVFLEINPVGQFGMISHPCNYNLERVVAEHLIERDDHAA